MPSHRPLDDALHRASGDAAPQLKCSGGVRQRIQMSRLHVPETGRLTMRATKAQLSPRHSLIFQENEANNINARSHVLTQGV